MFLTKVDDDGGNDNDDDVVCVSNYCLSLLRYSANYLWRFFEAATGIFRVGSNQTCLMAEKKFKLNINTIIFKPITPITKTLNKNYNIYCFNKFYHNNNNFI